MRKIQVKLIRSQSSNLNDPLNELHFPGKFIDETKVYALQLNSKASQMLFGWE